MDLNDLPKKWEWTIRNGNTLLIKDLAWMPILKFDRNIVEFFLDARFAKQTLKLVEYFVNKNMEIYFLSYELSNPCLNFTTEDQIYLNMQNYLLCYSNPKFFDGFKKIGFDFIENFVKYSKKMNSISQIKEVLDTINEFVQISYFDYHSNREIYHVERQDIREQFKILYREIQINQIL